MSTAATTFRCGPRAWLQGRQKAVQGVFNERNPILDGKRLTLEFEPISKSVCSVTLVPLGIVVPYPFVSTFHSPWSVFRTP
jgi:hypothetical protein